MEKSKRAVIARIRIALGIALLTTVVAGCWGYVDGGYGSAVMVPEPDVVLFGGGYYGGGYYERGRDVREYSHRGFTSRAAVHSVGGGSQRRR